MRCLSCIWWRDRRSEPLDHELQLDKKRYSIRSVSSSTLATSSGTLDYDEEEAECSDTQSKDDEYKPNPKFKMNEEATMTIEIGHREHSKTPTQDIAPARNSVYRISIQQ